MISIFSIILAILGLSFLIFIHELGHYIMARRTGMRVDVFSIGFGKPIISWLRDGVKWQIGWLPFGGYVKIAGMETEGEKNPYETPEGFFSKPPLDRIKVALMGPLANLFFALLVFLLLWTLGGREKPFSEFSAKIGWVDPHSELYKLGVRPGDEVAAYDDHDFQTAKDHISGPLTSKDDKIEVTGTHIDYATGKKQPFNYTVPVYPHPAAFEKGIVTSGILQSANYILYKKLPEGKENPLPEGSPLIGSGIEYGDRIFWVNGEIVFSNKELDYLLNGNEVLLTIERAGQTLLVKVPRVQMQELRPDPQFKEEISDWQFAAGLQGTKLQNLYTIPYNLTNNAIVEAPVRFIDKEKEIEAFPTNSFSINNTALQPGDKIIAIYGIPISQSSQLLNELQTFRINVVVERNPELSEIGSWKDEDRHFDESINISDLNALVNSIGTSQPLQEKGNYVLLKTITPKVRSEFKFSPEKQALINNELQQRKKLIANIPDPEKRQQQMREIEHEEKRLLIGLGATQDYRVNYNPGPLAQFKNVLQEVWRTLTALLSGTLNPQWIAGPIGIVQIVHDSSMSNLKEALYWLGAISLNLGILNLLPIPVLDGGMILLCLFEMVTKKRIPPKVLERLLLPFAILLLFLFIFLTYNDLSRLLR